LLSAIPSVYCCYQPERGAEGTSHLQGKLISRSIVAETDSFIFRGYILRQSKSLRLCCQAHSRMAHREDARNHTASR
jgi:hypothetical protein